MKPEGVAEVIDVHPRHQEREHVGQYLQRDLGSKRQDTPQLTNRNQQHYTNCEDLVSEELEEKEQDPHHHWNHRYGIYKMGQHKRNNRNTSSKTALNSQGEL